MPQSSISLVGFDGGTFFGQSDTVDFFSRFLNPLGTINVADRGADLNGVNDSYDALQSAIDTAVARDNWSTVFLHPGIYRINQRLTLPGSKVRIYGPGAKILLGAALGDGDGACMLYITGSYNVVEHVEFDGNAAQAFTGKSRCIQINGTAGEGSNNLITRVHCHDTYNHPSSDRSSDTIQIVNGVDNVIERSLCERAGWNGIRVSGDGNHVRFNQVYDSLGRSIRFNDGETGFVYCNIISVMDIAAGACLLTDPENSQFGSFYCWGNRVRVKSNRVHAGSTGTNAMKCARTKYAYFGFNDVEILLDKYNTGTITYDHTGGANERQVTLSGGTWPTWAKSPGRIFINGVFYLADTRVSNTIITLRDTSNPGSDISSPTAFYFEQDYDNVGLRLEDGNDHVVVEGGRLDQILMTSGIMSGALSNHADNGSGKIRFTQTAHGWVGPSGDSPGDNGRIVYVTGCDTEEYNTKHVFTYVNGNTWDSDQPYVADTLGSGAKAHGATDILDVSKVDFGRGKHTKFAPMTRIKARVCRISRNVFDLRYDQAFLEDGVTRYDPLNRVGANTAINWSMPDNAFDILEVERNEAIFANDGAACRLVGVDDTMTQLMNSGKTRGRDNIVRNIGAGGTATVAQVNDFAKRSMLFATMDGKTYRDTAAPTEGNWSRGDVVWNSNPTVGQPIGWMCTTAPLTFTAMANL